MPYLTPEDALAAAPEPSNSHQQCAVGLSGGAAAAAHVARTEPLTEPHTLPTGRDLAVLRPYGALYESVTTRNVGHHHLAPSSALRPSTSRRMS